MKLSLQSGKNVVSYQCQLTERLSVLSVFTRLASDTFGLPCYLWNLGSNVVRSMGGDGEIKADFNSSTNPFAVLQFLQEVKEGFFILENLHSFLVEPESDISSQVAVGRLVSQISSLAFDWLGRNKFCILLGTQDQQLPPLLTSIVPEFWHPLPHYKHNVTLLDSFLPALDPEADLSLIPQLAISAGGLTTEEIKSGLRLVKAQNGGKLDNNVVKELLNYKIERLKAFNLAFSPRPNVKDFGGMDNIRLGIHAVKKRYSHEARSKGIPLPKGWLFVGPPGTGKTFVSKFCASILEFPMIAVDTGAIASGGASYLRRLIDRIEACAPAVVYFDELDKLFPDPGQAADVQQRQVLGLLLTWLQDKVSLTFVIATLNRLDCLPPELTRLGRFDEIFYVGFPQAGERKDILHLHLARFDERYKNGGDPLSLKQWRVILNKTINMTGAELSTMVEKAADKQFQEGIFPYCLGVQELLEARSWITPLFLRDTDRILKIENIAKGVATPASPPDDSIYAPEETTFWGQRISTDSSTTSVAA
ncbi:MAG TPA: AAA family ATPase [Cyanobacteria bacterium UBA8543]|nr:AAA family ATPase [Cyanobacteria bacterium UBA8543]